MAPEREDRSYTDLPVDPAGKGFWDDDGVWHAAFESQRPPLRPGHAVNRRHGAHRDSRNVAQRTTAILDAERAKESWPAYLEDPSMALVLRSWARATAICEVLEDYLAGKDIGDALSDVITTEESGKTYTDAHEVEHTKRKVKTRREASVLEMLRKWESVASNLSHRLGLDPLGRARLGKDVSQTSNADLAKYWQTDDPVPAQDPAAPITVEATRVDE